MTFIQSIILGALQGITEFLPVSSSGHLIITRHIMGLEEIPGFFDILMHFPTLLAIIIIFRKRIKDIFISLLRFFTGSSAPKDSENLRLLLIILLASAATATVGLGLSNIKDYFDKTPKIVSALFVITGLILIISRFFHGKKGYSELGIKEGLITGIAQGLGVLPGISRSGITISASLASNMNREKAGEYSFLILCPLYLALLFLKWIALRILILILLSLAQD